jgi:outer membrane protein TolC
MKRSIAVFVALTLLLRLENAAAQKTSGSHDAIQEAFDSLSLARLELNIRRAEARVTRTSVWHRLLPHVSFAVAISAGHEVFLNDPLSLPSPPGLRASYRLSLQLPLSALWESEEQDAACTDLKSLHLERDQFLLSLASRRASDRRRDSALQAERRLLGEQLKVLEAILRFRQLRFDQGECSFESLVQAEMDVRSMQIRLLRLGREPEPDKLADP